MRFAQSMNTLPASQTSMVCAVRRLLRHDPLLARSRKISVGAVSTERLLLTFPREAMFDANDPLSLGAVIGAELPDGLTRHWQRAEVVHLGLDEADTTGERIKKLYLEFSPETTPEPGLAYLALKAGSQGQLHRYELLDDPSSVLEHLALPSEIQAFICQLAVFGPVLRVSEPGSARLSVDIGLTEHSPDPILLASLGRIVAAVNPDANAPTCWPSHVAIGRDRNAVPFITLYGWPDGALP